MIGNITKWTGTCPNRKQQSGFSVQPRMPVSVQWLIGIDDDHLPIDSTVTDEADKDDYAQHVVGTVPNQCPPR